MLLHLSQQAGYDVEKPGRDSVSGGDLEVQDDASATSIAMCSSSSTHSTVFTPKPKKQSRATSKVGHRPPVTNQPTHSRRSDFGYSLVGMRTGTQP